MKRLLDRGLSVDTRLFYGETLLMYAAKYSQLELSENLIEYGADIKQKNNKSQAVLDAKGQLGYGLQERQIVRPKSKQADKLYESI